MSRAVAADDAPLLERFRSRGVLSPLDVHFARTVGRVGGERNERVLLAAALACRAPRHGHICIEPRRVATTVRLEPAPGEAAAPLPWPEPEAWLAVLRTSPLVAGEGLARNAAAPLVLQGDRLYLDRYFRYEERLVAAIRARLACPA
ncbi:MAG: exodeoxyribonuclease V subunit alpha, partial [Deltaproteobacteria bacterium]|nr:exodeoxyribonuclease V subunit alpha [Deltaproteobacteria bacterium]